MINDKNILDLKVGDEINFTNSVNELIKFKVRRITNSSCYLATYFGQNIHPIFGEDFIGGRNSFGTILKFTKYPDFKIIKNN